MKRVLGKLAGPAARLVIKRAALLRSVPSTALLSRRSVRAPGRRPVARTGVLFACLAAAMLWWAESPAQTPSNSPSAADTDNGVGTASSDQSGDAASTSASSPIARGEYLVHHVAMCVQCHSPRDASGQLDRSRLLTGGRIPVRPPWPDQQWAFTAPRIAGLPGWSVQDVATLLRTGRTPTGFAPRPPMPPFRMTQDDADAVAAYLASLGS